MHKYFEVHVTSLEELQCYEYKGWTTSRIDGDPEFGKGVRYYATKHTDTYSEALTSIIFAKQVWSKAIRFKIEHVLFDERIEK